MKGVIVGSYDEHGNPRIEFYLRGAAHEHPRIKYNGIVDTGFSGFLQINLFEGCRLQLPLEGIASCELADGSTETNLTALGIASLNNDSTEESSVGTVHLSFSDEVLIGMEFLRAFKKGLGVFKDQILLFPEMPKEVSE